MGFHTHLSKAVIYGDKCMGGLGLVSPIDLLDIETVANVARFVNSESPITRSVSRYSLSQARKGKVTDIL